MTRQPTPDDILGDVSQETTDDIVEMVMGKPASEAMFDNPKSAAVFGDFQLPSVGATYPSTPIMIRLDWLKDNPYQPRQTYTGIDELAENIRLNGLLQAPVARQRQGFYQLAFGHRRLRAYRQLAAQIGGEWRSMPVIVRPLTDEEMARHAWSENHNREDVSAVEEARLFQRMIDDFGLTQQEIADDVGKSRSAVANTLRLLQLPEQAQTLIETGRITERHGRELLRLAGAPKWLKKHLDDLVDDQRNGLNEVKTVSDLKRQIDQYIKLKGVFMPEEPIDARDRYDDKKKHLPPAWGWEYAPKSPDVVGPCRKCPQLVHFGGDPAPRCTNGTCHAAKDRLWREKERERQLEAARAAAALLPAAVLVYSSTTAKPSTVSEPDQPVDEIPFSRQDQHNLRVFGSNDAPAGLLKHGLCGKGKCECFKLKMIQDYRTNPKMLGPDRDTAPDVVFVCDNSSRLHAQRNRLQEIEAPLEAQKRKDDIQAKSTQTRQAKDKLRQAWERLTPADLAGNAAFMRLIAGSLSMAMDGSATEIWERIYWLQAERLCEVSEWRGVERFDRWDLDKIDKFLEKMTSSAPVQPGPGDSKKTGWENGWDDMDAGLWALLTAYPGPILPENVDQPRVLLRAIETTTDKDTRGALWRRYYQLTNENEGEPHDPTDA